MLAQITSVISVTASSGEVVIIYTNDTHCAVDSGLGFEDVSAIKAIETARGNEVAIVDAGDAVQGGAIGSLSSGEYIVNIMNHIGYDVAALGNHEFDYGTNRLMELSKIAAFPYVCSNLLSLEANDTVFEPYHIISFANTDIAFLGVTTPNTFTSTAPEYFKNDAGEYIYDFGGNDFSDLVQKNIDAAVADGADYVIALTHLGVDPADEPYTSKSLIESTTGLDAVIDAHSHTVIESETVKDENGDDVILTSTGSKFENIGTLRISDTGHISTELINEEYKMQGIPPEASDAYGMSQAYINSIKSNYETELEQVIAYSDVNLTVNDPQKFSEQTGAYRLVRRGETNLGDFCTDAYRAVLDCDVAIVNGGGVRADIEKGDVSYGDILNVHPFGNELCVVEVTGAQILDALEHGARSYPAEEGSFLQVSGLSYEIDESVKSSVVLDDKGLFLKVAGDRRVKNVMIGQNPIDENQTYTLGGSTYTIMDGGDGFSMFGDAKIIKSSVCTDSDALIKYVTDFLDGKIGTDYENPYGDGRITLYDAPLFGDIDGHWAKDKIVEAAQAGIMNGTEERIFSPDENVTRGMFAAIMFRASGSEIPETTHSFTDISDDAYYKDAVAWAYASNVMTGTGDTTFSPDELISREQMATAILRYCTYLEKGPVGAWAIRLDYTDTSEMSDWAVEGIMFTKINAIMQGDENNCFNPTSSATRAETAVTVLRALNYIGAE